MVPLLLMPGTHSDRAAPAKVRPTQRND